MPQVPRGPASEWSVEEVIQYITATDPALDVHAKLFRDHVSHMHSQNEAILKLKNCSNLISALILHLITYYSRRKLTAKHYFSSTPI